MCPPHLVFVLFVNHFVPPPASDIFQLMPTPPSTSQTAACPQAGLTLLRRLPDTLTSPVQISVRRKLVREWLLAQARLRGTTLVIATRPPNAIFFAVDVRHVHFLSSPSARRPTLLVRSSANYNGARLRLIHRASDWVRALTTIAMNALPRLSNFHVQCPIGKGGGGEVYLVRDSHLIDGPALALKVVQKRNAFASHSTLRRALDERLALELVRDFPFVVRLVHAFQTATAFYLLTNFCSGGDLRTLLRRHRNARMSEETAKPLLAQIVLALEYVHSLNIIYRDLKPENVLLSSDFHIRLCDFGLCKVLSSMRLARAKSFCGSTMYMSPQVVSGTAYGFATDLWSLGALIFRVLVGRGPFEAPLSSVGVGNDSSEVHKRIVNDIPAVPGFVSSEARSLLYGLLTKQEEERFTLEDVKNCEFFKGVDWEKVLQDGYTRAKTEAAAVACATSKAQVRVDIEKSRAKASIGSQLDATVVKDLSNFDAQRLISHGVMLDDEELADKRVGRVKMRQRSEERDGSQGRAVRKASLVASSLSSLFQRDSVRDFELGDTTVVGFDFSPVEQNLRFSNELLTQLPQLGTQEAVVEF